MTPPVLACEVCAQPLVVGDHVQVTCVGFRCMTCDRTLGSGHRSRSCSKCEPLLSYVHSGCLDVDDRQN